MLNWNESSLGNQPLTRNPSWAHKWHSIQTKDDIGLSETSKDVLDDKAYAGADGKGIGLSFEEPIGCSLRYLRK